MGSLLNGEWFCLSDVPGSSNPFEVLVYAEENTLLKLRTKLGDADLLVKADIQLPKEFAIPKLFGQRRVETRKRVTQPPKPAEAVHFNNTAPTVISRHGL